MSALRFGRPLCCALACLIFSPGLFGAPRFIGALWATEVDDNRDYQSFASYLGERSDLPHEELSMAGRAKVTLLGAGKAPAAFASYRVLNGPQEIAGGRSFADGSFFLYPDRLPQAAPRLRVEASARGAAAVLESSILPSGEATLDIGAPRPVPKPLSVDLVLVVDTTSSMGPYLPALGSSIAKALDAIPALAPGIDLRVGLVLFRDRDEAYLTKSLPLTGDRAAILRALDRVEAERGGDEPEALGDGLEAALGLFGNGESLRLVFAFTDAPPKLSMVPGIASYAAACASALKAGVRLYTVGMGDVKPAAEYGLRQIAAYTGAAYLNAGSSAAQGGAGRAPDAASSAPGNVASGAVGGASLRGELSGMIARLVATEVSSVTTGQGNRDPALALLDSVQARMAALLSYPEAARRRGAEGSARVALSVAPDGTLLKSRIASSSGSALLDSAALALARSAFPTKNPAAASVELEIAVGYRLEEKK
jgi:TonB family protein